MSATPPYTAADGHGLLMSFLLAARIAFGEIAHPPAGNTVEASALRGHPPEHAPKCLVLMICGPGNRRRYVNVVVTGDRRVSFPAVLARVGGDRVMMAPHDRAVALTGCVSGSVIPFSFHPDLELVVDEAVARQPRLVFNAGKLDQSVSIRTADYLAAVRPQLARIAQV